MFGDRAENAGRASPADRSDRKGFDVPVWSVRTGRRGYDDKPARHANACLPATGWNSGLPKLVIVVFMSARLRLMLTLPTLWAGAVAASAVSAQERVRIERSPNIVLILADDLGYGDPGCYNPQSKIPTPYIDALAAQGLRFTDAHAPGAVCVPTRFALMTGRYPFRRPNRNGAFDAGPLIDEATVTLPETLQSVGYRTAMVGKWHLGFGFDGFERPLRGGPADTGFASYFGIPASLDIPPYFYIEGRRAVAAPTGHIDDHGTPGVSPIQGAFWRGGDIAPEFVHAQVLPILADHAAAVLDERAKQPDEPFFLYVALTAPHTPWLPSAEFEGQSEFAADSPLGLYGNFVTQVDAILGRLLERLEAQGLSDNTLVIFTSDNGPTWYDADAVRSGHDSAGPWRGMKGDVYEAGHRVPLIIRWPGHVPAGQTCDALVSLHDTRRTLARIAGAEAGADDGLDLTPLWLGTDGATGRKSLVVESSGKVLALRHGAWKFVPQLGSGGFSLPRQEIPAAGGPAVQLYDLASDPGETQNLALQRPEIVKVLAAELARVRAAVVER